MTRPSLCPRELARLLDGEAFGNNVVAPGPGHSRKDRSLSVTVDPSAPYGIRVNTFSSRNDKAACWRYFWARLGFDRAPAPGDVGSIRQSMRREHLRGAGRVVAGDKFRFDPNDAERSASAFSLWAESRPPAGTPVECYLASRSLVLPDRAEDALRYHPACPFAGRRIPAMVALVRNAATNEPRAVHRTAFDPDGRKVQVDGKDRLALGPIAGAAVKLTGDEDVSHCLGVGEGLETTLSLREVPEYGASPVWALLSAGGLADFPPLSGIQSLWIAVDRDEAGERAARACAERWQAAGREVFLVAPKAARSDMKDVVANRRSRHAAR